MLQARSSGGICHPKQTGINRMQTIKLKINKYRNLSFAFPRLKLIQRVDWRRFLHPLNSLPIVNNPHFGHADHFFQKALPNQRFERYYSQVNLYTVYFWNGFDAYVARWSELPGRHAG